MESSQFTKNQPHFDSLEPIDTQGATCDAFRVKLYGKLHFLKRLKPEYAADIRYQEAFRKEFETGYRLEHPNLVRYISLTDDGILMEYVDGETLTQRLAAQPEYFQDKNHTDKFLQQLLDAVGYLHSHQVLHLDLKPDNILLTRINGDVKLVDLGCCHTDSFVDTPGYSRSFAAPEQLQAGTVDARTDIYAIGKIIAALPDAYNYNKVAARCTANAPDARYQSIDELRKALFRRRHIVRWLVVAVMLLAILWAVYYASHSQQSSQPLPISTNTDTTTTPMAVEEPAPPSMPPENTAESAPQPADPILAMEKEMDVLIDKAYRHTIYTLRDSVFPSATVGPLWQQQSTVFHQQVLLIGEQLSKAYPSLQESVIRQKTETKFQALTTYIFNRMRDNGEKE